MKIKNHRQQRGGIMTKIIGFMLIIALVASAGFGYVAYSTKQKILAEGPLETPVILWVERGNGIVTVGEKLLTLGAIENPMLFKLQSRLSDLAPVLQAGEYEIVPGASVQEIVDHLKDGKPLLRFVTIPEGLTTKQILVRVTEAPMIEGEITLAPAEGALLPETYSYQRGDTRNSVIKRMMKAHDKVLAELWEGRADDLPIKTPFEAVILASIVEKETGLAEERPLVASVFINRLKHRPTMRLQSDPTIIYGLTGGEPLGRGIRRSELNRVTPYNTYKINGLPPTPIANPGVDALAAVLNPPSTEYLFFVADGTGGHVFARNNAEHVRNVREWRQVERQRNNGN